MGILTTFHSDVVLGQVKSTDAGYTTTDLDITFATGMEIGALLKADGTWATIAEAALVAGVYTHSCQTEFTNAVAFTGTMNVRGTTFNKNLLTYSDGAIDAAGEAQLVALGNKVTDKVYGTAL